MQQYGPNQSPNPIFIGAFAIGHDRSDDPREATGARVVVHWAGGRPLIVRHDGRPPPPALAVMDSPDDTHKQLLGMLEESLGLNDRVPRA